MATAHFIVGSGNQFEVDDDYIWIIFLQEHDMENYNSYCCDF